jgi:hypothetical protein
VLNFRSKFMYEISNCELYLLFALNGVLIDVAVFVS